MNHLTPRAVLVVAIAAALAVVFVGSQPASAGTVVGSNHDLRATGGGTPTGTGLTEVCVVCHTPHQATAANSQDPLWNHTATSTASFGVYASATLNAVPTALAGGSVGALPYSLLCLSCHDGTVSVLSMYNPPNAGTPTVAPLAGRIDLAGRIISNANVGTNLSDDHPVNFTYDAALVTADGGLQPPPAARLIGGTVQCSSCHDAHDPTNSPFLVTSNAGSALCLQCHIK